MEEALGDTTTDATASPLCLRGRPPGRSTGDSGALSEGSHGANDKPAGPIRVAKFPVLGPPGGAACRRPLLGTRAGRRTSHVFTAVTR
ncbi:hypothetical protein MRX96_017638 [Rhipicephalus microplus]